MVNQRAIVIAHGVLAALAWVIFFPLGAILVRVLNRTKSWKVHASMQIFAMAVFTTAVGLGLQIATRSPRYLRSFHAIIGLTVFGAIFVQALGGVVHHLLFRKHQHRTVVSYVHLWLGRALITLGMINGGLGLLINGNSTRAQNIAYGVVAGVIWVGYLVTSAVFEVRKKKADDVVMAKEKAMHERESVSTDGYTPKTRVDGRLGDRL